MPITLNGDTGIQTPMYNGTITANAVTPSVNMKNRIINGAMTIDQRNAGASVTVNGGAFYGVDRWKGEDGTDGDFTIQQTTTAPAGFNNSTKITITNADASLGATQYSYFGQVIEGYNFADLGWGTANAKTVTLSFWVQSSVTGTYTASFINNAQNRSYPATFTISSANTWEYKTITVAGDTTGTWLTTNDGGLKLYICMGTGSTYTGTGNAWSGSLYFNATGSVNLINTAGATFYITGVQLEVGSTATSFDYRPYGTELALCQRYCNRLDYANTASVNTGYVDSATSARGGLIFPTMRTSASASASSGTHFKLDNGAGAYVGTGISFDGLTPTSARMILTSSGMTGGQGGIFLSVNNSAYILLTAEL